MANLFLAAAITVATFIWYRNDFRQPRLWPLARVSPRKVVTAAGVTIMALTVLLIVGDTLGGYTSLNLSPARHVHRSTDPFAFWLQIVLQIAVGVTTGAVLTVCGRSPAHHRNRTGRGMHA